MKLHVLSAGAAQGLVSTLEPRFHQATGLRLECTFGPVGSLWEMLSAGAPCDVVILTKDLIDTLSRQGEVEPEVCAALGQVRTGVALPTGSPLPDIRDAANLRAALRTARTVFFPDPKRATAGIHFMNVLRALDLDKELATRLQPLPSGVTAMRELAACGEATAIGCTQVTEILCTQGVTLVGPLPKEFELVTVYSVAILTRTTRIGEARRLAQMLSELETAKLRQACGFE